eukprot:COSAG02_NODE_5499_length_4278_cov_4.999282_2_plen_67_part_00
MEWCRDEHLEGLAGDQVVRAADRGERGRVRHAVHATDGGQGIPGSIADQDQEILSLEIAIQVPQAL